MIYFLLLVVGISLGMLFKSKIIEWINSFLIKKKQNYKVKFHAYFVIHKSGSRLNEIIKTDSIEIIVRSESEDDAIMFLRELINSESRVEIESIDEIQ